MQISYERAAVQPGLNHVVEQTRPSVPGRSHTAASFVFFVWFLACISWSSRLSIPSRSYLPRPSQRLALISYRNRIAVELVYKDLTAGWIFQILQTTSKKMPVDIKPESVGTKL